MWFMASVTYGKCIMANVIMAKIIMAKILWQMKLSRLCIFPGLISLFSVSVSLYSLVLHPCFLSPSLNIPWSYIFVFHLHLSIFSVLISLFSFSGLTSLFSASVSIKSQVRYPCFPSLSLYIPWSYIFVFCLRL